MHEETLLAPGCCASEPSAHGGEEALSLDICRTQLHEDLATLGWCWGVSYSEQVLELETPPGILSAIISVTVIYALS